ncbi:MAG: DinB family protein [Flammeovirgaceae bacterium]
MTTLQICLLQWDALNKRMSKTLDSISEENFHRPIVANGNSPSWIMGHLVEADDALLELLGIGPRLFPNLSKIYHHERGTNQSGHLAKAELVNCFKIVSEALNKTFKSWSENDWLSKHTAVSDADFEKEPHRCRLNVMLSRVSHKASHLGQITLLK